MRWGEVSDVLAATGMDAGESLRLSLLMSLGFLVVPGVFLVLLLRHLVPEEANRIERARAAGRTGRGTGGVNMRSLSRACALALLATAGLTWANETIETDLAADQAVPWTSLAANDAAGDFHFVIVSDRTGGARPGVFESAIPKVNLLEPAFVVSVGDLIEGNTEDQAQLDREWDEFEGFVAGLETPFFYAAGNHDMSNAVMAATWQARFGPSYYRFVYKDVLFLVLNSELFGMVRDMHTPVPGPWTQAEQMAFIAETLRRFPNPRWTIVIIHQPRWDYADAPQDDWQKVEAMLGQRDYTVFAAPFAPLREDRAPGPPLHHPRHHRRRQQLRGLMHGEFDQVALVSMTDAGPRIANLTLGRHPRTRT